MNLGDQLRKQVDRRQNKEVAITWLERWKAVEPTFNRQAKYVVQQFSRCLNQNLSGVRFFFKDRRRAEVLFDVLEIVDDQRHVLWEVAQQLLGESAPTPVAVVDLTSWSDDRDESLVFNELRRMLDEVPTLGPVTLVVTLAQAERIPNGLANLRGVSLERVSSPAEGWEKTLDLTTETTLVVSKSRYENLDHWMALDVDDDEVQAHPDDGLKIFAESGTLPPPMAVIHPLSALGHVDSDVYVDEPDSAAELRQLIFELADEDSRLCRQMSAPRRAALAAVLGAEATSTARERLEHELGGLTQQVCEALSITEPSAGEPGDVDKELAIRMLRTMPAKVMRVGDQLHVFIEPGQGGEALPMSARISVYENHPKAVLREFLADLEGWGDEDYLRDPYYDRLLERLDPPEEMKLIYHHARAFLLATGHRPQPRPDTPADWRVAIEAVLTGDPPAAELLVPVEHGDKRLFGRPMRWLDIDDGSRVVVDQELGAWWRNLPPATSNIALGRHCKARLNAGNYRFIKFPERDRWDRRPEPEPEPRQGLLALRTLNGDPIAACQSLIDASGLLSNYRDSKILDYERNTLVREGYDRFVLSSKSLGIFTGLDDPGSELSIVQGTWTRADNHIGALWLALRMALRDPLFTTFHDGSVLLSLGGPVLVRIRAQTSFCRYPGPRRVFLAGPLQKEKYGQDRWIDVPERSLYTHEAVTGDYTTQLGLRLPSQVLILAEGFRVSMTFVGSGLLSPGVGAPPLGAIAGSVAGEARRDADDYDDD